MAEALRGVAGEFQLVRVSGVKPQRFGQHGEAGDERGFGFGIEPDASSGVTVAALGRIGAGELRFADPAEAVERGERGGGLRGGECGVDGGDDVRAVLVVAGGRWDGPEGGVRGERTVPKQILHFFEAAEEGAVDPLLLRDPTAALVLVAQHMVMRALDRFGKVGAEVRREWFLHAGVVGQTELLVVRAFRRVPAHQERLHATPPVGAELSLVRFEMLQVRRDGLREKLLGQRALDVIAPGVEPVAVPWGRFGAEGSQCG